MFTEVWTPFHPRVQLGGSTAHGGSASTAEGHYIAFGNTEESMRVRVLGVTERGSAGAAAPLNRHDRTTGLGYVGARAGDYSDALEKGHRVHLLAAESTGAIGRSFATLLHHLAKLAKARNSQDGTLYGRGRQSTRSFYDHHLSAISAAIVTNNALSIINAASALNFALTLGQPAARERSAGGSTSRAPAPPPTPASVSIE